MANSSDRDRSLKLVQVCNVGEICGGTAACAWSITHALPEMTHAVIFLSQPNSRTLEAFRHCQVEIASSVGEQFVSRLNADFVILHNTSPQRVSRIRDIVTVQYHHSSGHRTAADLHIACSNWLASQTTQTDEVLYQPTPRPSRPRHELRRSVTEELRIGRLCTPSQRKWPRGLLSFYETLAKRHPHVVWEFVGVPESLQSEFAVACQARVLFHPAGTQARSLLWNWHAMLYHHPTLTESFGRVAAEAMRAGCVPIVDSKGGFLEQIGNGEHGFLCDHLEMFSAAIEALSDRARWMGMSAEAKLAADQRFSLESFRGHFMRRLISLC